MNLKLKWSLIIFTAVLLLGAAIGIGIVLLINHRNNQKKKFREELNESIKEASAEAVKEIAEEEGKKASADKVLVGNIVKALPGIEIADTDILNAKKAVAKCVKDVGNKKHVNEVEISAVRRIIESKITVEIESKAKEIVKKSTVEAVWEKIETLCFEAVKLGTDTDINEAVENGAYEETAKMEVSRKAEKIVKEKAAEVFGGFSVDKMKIETKAKEALVNAKFTIKRDIMYNAIKEAAGVEN